MITVNQLRTKFQNNGVINIAVIGDSTTCGFGANPSPNTWTNGLSYGCVNQPRHGENWQPYLADGVTPNPVYINTSGYPSQAQQDNVNIPSAVRLLRTEVERRNASSKVYNYGGSGWVAADHVSSGTVALVAGLTPKPDVILFNLGINSAKNNNTQIADLRILVSQALSNNILPILVKPNNIGVAGSPSGSWSATATPDTWYPMDNWYQIRNGIDTVANENGLSIIDVGTPDMQLDITLLYDPFHPSNLGYQVIANKYISFLDSVTPIIGAFIKTRDGRTYPVIKNGNSSFKIKLSTGDIVTIPLDTSILSFLRMKTGAFIASFKEI